MNVGLPGTGIGGLFYMFSVGIIFVSEVIHTLRKKSSKRRWKVAVEQFFLTTSMIAVAAVVNVLFAMFLSKKAPVQPRTDSVVVNT